MLLPLLPTRIRISSPTPTRLSMLRRTLKPPTAPNNTLLQFLNVYIPAQAVCIFHLHHHARCNPHLVSPRTSGPNLPTPLNPSFTLNVHSLINLLILTTIVQSISLYILKDTTIIEIIELSLPLPTTEAMYLLIKMTL